MHVRVVIHEILLFPALIHTFIERLAKDVFLSSFVLRMCSCNSVSVRFFRSYRAYDWSQNHFVIAIEVINNHMIELVTEPYIIEVVTEPYSQHLFTHS